MKKLKALVFVLLVCGVAGCFTQGGGCRPKPKTEAEKRTADSMMLTLMAAQLNAQQTNWTVLVVPRTNAPLETNWMHELFKKRTDGKTN